MASTIVFTPKGDGASYTVADINALFAAIAAVINAKADLDASSTLTSDWNINDRSFINVAPGTVATDAVTLRQALALIDQ